ncbi:non-homologous end-joining DNA ligase [Streptomyces globisporus]|uniref:non-homologous end-joining DNA ligase n=1 Tax=Streptomyces globisporus TaxID=1908 RepID=UPI0004C5D2E8|nr:non-homologous end-joining DNA ligase [Streptomyces globisporus]
MSVLDQLSATQRERLRTAEAKAREQPMLAVLSDRRTFDDDMLFERKLDGVRAVAIREGDRLRLLSRTGRNVNPTYPEIVDALAAQVCRDFTVDGEITAIKGGRSDFALLQQRMGLTRPKDVRAGRVSVRYYLFDLLSLDGRRTTALPLRTRKSLLRDALDFRAPLRYTPHRVGRDGRQLLADACGRGGEGLIAKRADGPYLHHRSTDWLKLKCAADQELVIGGFTEPAGSRVGFGALLVGHYEGDRLRCAGKVGTGYDTRPPRSLRTRLDRLEQDRSPFADDVRERAVHWVRPELVAQIGFTEWTGAGRLRHPRYMGLRDDKRPTDVIRERGTP